MKNFKRGKPSTEFLDKITYEDTNTLKQLIRYIPVAVFDDNADIICIIVDVKSILNVDNVLTSRQKKVIIEHLINDKPQKELALELNTTQQNISLLLNSALKRIQKYIRTGEVRWTEWTSHEKEFLLKNYNKLSVDELVKELGKPPSRLSSMYHYLKKSRGG